MTSRIGRTLPPAASPISCKDLVSGLAGILGGSKFTRRFEQQIEEKFCVSHCFAVSSGKAALELILKALHDICPDRDEVLIPAYTCYSVPSAIVKAGLKVRLCDISSETLDFDFNLLSQYRENPRLLCVIPIHLFGFPADVERIRSMFIDCNVFVVEDAAQVMGCEWNGQPLGVKGHVGMFSLGRGKAFSTVEGGIILTSDELIAQKIRERIENVSGYGPVGGMKIILYSLVLSFFIHPWVYWLPNSLPFLKLGETHFDLSYPVRRLSSFQAGLAKRWQSKIEVFSNTRRSNVKKYIDAGVSLPTRTGLALPSLIRHPVILENKEAKTKVLLESEKKGLGVSDGYPDSIDGIVQLQHLFVGATFPVAKAVAKRIILLPVHPFVKDDDIKQIASVLKHHG